MDFKTKKKYWLVCVPTRDSVGLEESCNAERMKEKLVQLPIAGLGIHDEWVWIKWTALCNSLCVTILRYETNIS